MLLPYDYFRVFTGFCYFAFEQPNLTRGHIDSFGYLFCLSTYFFSLHPQRHDFPRYKNEISVAELFMNHEWSIRITFTLPQWIDTCNLRNPRNPLIHWVSNPHPLRSIDTPLSADIEFPMQRFLFINPPAPLKTKPSHRAKASGCKLYGFRCSSGQNESFKRIKSR